MEFRLASQSGLFKKKESLHLLTAKYYMRRAVVFSCTINLQQLKTTESQDSSCTKTAFFLHNWRQLQLWKLLSISHESLAQSTVFPTDGKAGKLRRCSDALNFVSLECDMRWEGFPMSTLSVLEAQVSNDWLSMIALSAERIQFSSNCWWT